MNRTIICLLTTSILLLFLLGGCASSEQKIMRVARYDEAARKINAPIYKYYAEQIKKKTGITRGTCVDIGCGGGYLGLELARITSLDFIFLDISAEFLEKAQEHIAEDGLQKRARTVVADVHKMPLADNSVDLVISRGSIPFWKDHVTALKEIYRILAPGGRVYIGGGRGTPEIQAAISSRRKELGMDKEKGPWSKNRKGPAGIPRHDYEKILKKTGIKNCAFTRSNDGMWIQMWK